MPRFSSIVSQLPATVPFVAPEALERKMGKPLRARLGANESAFGMSPRALAAMEQAAAESWMYGDPNSFELRTALAEKHNVEMDQICVGAGIDDLLGLIARAFVEVKMPTLHSIGLIELLLGNRGTPVVASLGSYPTFQYHVNGFGGKHHFVPYGNFANDLEGLAEEAGKRKASLVYLSNPDNPTGTWHSPRAIEKFLTKLPTDCLLVLDEAYADFAPEKTEIKPEEQNVILLRTFSKAFGMAGARIGYGIASREIIGAFDKIRHHFGVSRVAQAGALASLRDEEFLKKVLKETEEGRKDYEALANELGMSAVASQTNFVAMDAGSAERSQEIIDALLTDGVFIRRPSIGSLATLIRITVGPPKEREILADSLRRICNQ